MKMGKMISNRTAIIIVAFLILLVSGIVGYVEYNAFNKLYFVVEMGTSSNGVSQVFFNEGNGYSEKDSYSIQIKNSNIQKYIFPMPGNHSIKSMRFDPIDIAGVVRIKDAWVENKQGDVVKKFFLQDFKQERQIFSLDIIEGVLTVQTDEHANDPILAIANSSIENHFSWTDYLKMRGWVIIGYGLLIFFFLFGLNYLVIYSSYRQYFVDGARCLKQYIEVNPKKCELFIIGLFATILFGIKLWLIGAYGNATPFWDQWDGEAAKLYKPFIDGTIKVTDLFAAHNEHRIFTTRVLALALLKINEIWNPLLQMVVDAGLHIIALVLCIVFLARVIGRNYLPALLVFSLLLFGIPYGFENTLSGFQAQFYFVILFCIASMWFITTQQPLSLSWWYGIVFAVLAFFSLASGVFALAATVATGITIYFLNIRRDKVQLIAIIILLVMLFGGLYFTPTIAEHAGLKAKSFLQLYEGLLSIFSWPLPGNLGALFLRNLPVLLLGAWVIRYRPPATDKIWFFVTLVFWMVGQALSIAYGRNSQVLNSRYLDLFAIGVLLNFASLLWLSRIYLRQHHRIVILFLSIWIISIVCALCVYVTADSFKRLSDKKLVGMAQETNTRAFLLTGDFTYLKGKSWALIPFPDEALARIISYPEIRAILPTNIRCPLHPSSVLSKPDDAFVLNGYSPATPKCLDTTVGSFGSLGSTATGNALLRFDDNRQSTLLAIPIAGYPLSNGMKIEVEQNGTIKPISIKTNPKESWGMAYVKVESGPFTIHINDLSNTAWVAVGNPILVGRLDLMTNSLLDNYLAVSMLGLLLGLLLLMHCYLSHFLKKSRH